MLMKRAAALSVAPVSVLESCRDAFVEERETRFDFVEGIAAEFFDDGGRDFKGDDVFDDDARRRDGARVAPLEGRFHRFFRFQID